MPKVIDLIIEREKIYKENTNIIFEHMNNVIDGIVEYVGQDPKTFKWDTVAIANGLVVITARTDVLEETTMVQNNLTGEITEMPSVTENGERLQRSLTIGIPLELVEGASPGEIVDFLIEMDEKFQNEELIAEQERISHKVDTDSFEEMDPRMEDNIFYNKRTRH